MYVGVANELFMFIIVNCFIGHAVNEIDEIWQHISRGRVARTGRNLAD